MWALRSTVVLRSRGMNCVRSECPRIWWTRIVRQMIVLGVFHLAKWSSRTSLRTVLSCPMFWTMSQGSRVRQLEIHCFRTRSHMDQNLDSQHQQVCHLSCQPNQARMPCSAFRQRASYHHGLRIKSTLGVRSTGYSSRLQSPRQRNTILSLQRNLEGRHTSSIRQEHQSRCTSTRWARNQICW